MRARAVIGANFGDCGKGLIVDHLCRTEGAGIVVRSNSGAQAGHTVVDATGRRHVFRHFGAGTLSGVPTFLSQFFACNPILFFQELDELLALGVKPQVYAHPNCLITTFADMLINQSKEQKRADKRHGSCGVGFHETIVRSEILPKLKITMADLWNNVNLELILEEICDKYANFRCGHSIEVVGGIEAFIKGCEAFAEYVNPLGIGQCKDPIFECAQGLLLDQNNTEYFPHLTHSNTGMKNVWVLCGQAGVSLIDTYYVSRTYLTRHGAGPLPGEDSSMRFEETTNLINESQGEFRFAPLDIGELVTRCSKDFGKSTGYSLALTHCDQLAPASAADLYVYGPTSEDVYKQPMLSALEVQEG